MKIERNVNLAELSAFGIGGKAKYFCMVRNSEEFLEAVALAKLKNIAWKVFGSGSNVVFPDYNLPYLLICFSGCEMQSIGETIFAGAGTKLADVVAKSIGLGLSGLEKLSGIPGTIGGAIIGNAGAYGNSISQVVGNVEIFDGHAKMWIPNLHCDFGYRESIFKRKPYIVLQASLKFAKGDKRELRKISREIIKMRLKKYLPNLKCPGSFFKNVLVKDIPRKSLELVDKLKIIDRKIPAGYLLEEAGAKGLRFGGIKIADFHGNLFINDGTGTAYDVYRLAQVLKDLVKAKFGITLEEEVEYF